MSRRGARSTRPASGASTPARIRNRVVLPAPLGPTMPTRSRPSTASDTPSSTTWPPNEREIPRARSTDDDPTRPSPRNWASKCVRTTGTDAQIPEEGRFGGMRAVVARSSVHVVLRVVDQPDPPPPGPGRLTIDVEAAGVNYVDALFVQGRYQIKPPLPFVPGSEVAGAGGGRGRRRHERRRRRPGARLLWPGCLRRAGLRRRRCRGPPARRPRRTPGGRPSRRAMPPRCSRCGSGDGWHPVRSCSCSARAADRPGDDRCRPRLGARTIAAASSGAKRDAALGMGAEAAIDTTTEPLKDRAGPWPVSSPVAP